MRKQYTVIARLAPLTAPENAKWNEAVLVSPKNGRFFSSLEEAKAAAEDHRDLADMIVGQVDVDCLDYSDSDSFVHFRGLSPAGYFCFHKNKGLLAETDKATYEMTKTMTLVVLARKKAGLA